MAVINGTEGDDILDGTSGDDTINGFGGNDIINGGDGADRIDGGDGNDYINPGSSITGASEVILGSFGSDTIDYSQADSYQNLVYGYVDVRTNFIINVDDNEFTVFNSSFTDTILSIENLVQNHEGIMVGGTALSDRFYVKYNGDGEQVVIQPGDGTDQFYLDGTAAETQGDVRLFLTFDTVGLLLETGVHIDLSLSSGQIVDDGFGNTETIYGDGHFTEFQLTFADDVFVGSDADEEIDAYSGTDYIDGGGGTDLIDFRASDYRGIVVNLDEGWATGQMVGPYGTKNLDYTLINVEDVDGSSGFADDITGSAEENMLRGGGGDDTLRGLGGNDTLIGDEGDDVLTGGMGDDLLTGGGGADRFVFALGDDHDTITDFQGAFDVLVLTGLPAGVAPIDLLPFVHQDGADLVLSAGTDSITLEDTQLTDLSFSNVEIA